MQTVGLSVILGADFSSAEEAMAKFRQSVNSLASDTSKAFANMAGTASNIGNAFKPVADGARNATQVVINESRARVQIDNEETQSALNASKLKIQALREEQAAQRAATQAKRAEKDEYGRLVEANNQIVRAYYNAAAAAIRMKDNTAETTAKLKEMAAAALAGQEQLKSIEAGAGRFQRNVGNYSSATQYLNQSIAQLTGEIPNFFQSLKIGFMSISNNIQPILFALEGLKRENAELAAQGLATKSAFEAVTKSLFGWQTLLFVGVGLVSAYGGKLVDMVTGADQAKAKAKELKDRQTELNNAFESGASSASKQIVEIQSLAAEMTNSNTPLSKKIDLYNQIIAQYPQLDTGTGTWAEKISNLAGVINTELIPALRKQAIMQGYAAEAAKLGQQLAAKSAESAGLLAKRQANRAIVSLSASPSRSALRDAAAAEKAYSENESAVKDLNRELDAMIKNQVQVSQELDKTILSHQTYKQQLQNTVRAEQARLDVLKAGTPEFEKQYDILQKAKNALKAYDPPLKDAKTHLDALTKSTNNYNASMADTEARLKAGIITPLEALQENAKAAQSQLAALYKNGGSDAEREKYIEQLKRLNYEMQSLAGRDLNSLKGNLFGGNAEKEFHQMITYMDSLKDRAANLYNNLGLTNTEDAIKRRKAVGNLESYGIDASKYVDFSRPVKEQTKEAEKALKNLQESFNSFASRTGRIIGRAVDPLTDAILNGRNAMDALGESVKNLLADLIKAVAKAALLSALGSKDQVSSVGGFGGILGGLLGLGLKGIPFLADGGVVTKPTLAMIGEAGPEAVQPLSKLGQYGGGNQNISLTTRWRGGDIVGVSDRYNKRRNY